MGFSYTNTTKSGETISPNALGLVTNYARVTDEPDTARVSNKTASLEQPEIVTFRCKPVDKVSLTVPVRNPAPVIDGVQYSIVLESIYRSVVGGVNVDEPIKAWLTIQHPSSDTFTNAIVAEFVERLLSCALKGQASTGSGSVADADWRYEDLMRSALMPSVD